MCVCVVIPFILDAPAGVGSHRRKVTQDFSSTFLLRCLPSFLSREGFSRPFPSSAVKSNFVYPRINRSPLVGHFLFLFLFLRGCPIEKTTSLPSVVGNKHTTTGIIRIREGDDVTTLNHEYYDYYGSQLRSGRKRAIKCPLS